MDDMTMTTVQPVDAAVATRVRAYPVVRDANRAMVRCVSGTGTGVDGTRPSTLGCTARAFHATAGFATIAPNFGSWKRSTRHLGRRSIT